MIIPIDLIGQLLQRQVHFAEMHMQTIMLLPKFLKFVSWIPKNLRTTEKFSEATYMWTDVRVRMSLLF